MVGGSKISAQVAHVSQTHLVVLSHPGRAGEASGHWASSLISFSFHLSQINKQHFKAVLFSKDLVHYQVCLDNALMHICVCWCGFV